MTLDHKTSHKCQFIYIEYIIRNFARIGQYLANIQLFEIWNLRVLKNRNIENIAFKVDESEIKFLAMHFTSKKKITNQIYLR